MDGDTDWPERDINSYAVITGYLMIAIKALSLFIFTWITVVLLGGFVSVLAKEDFWRLTGILLLQPAGVFAIIFDKVVSNFVHYCWHLLVGTLTEPFGNGLNKDDGRTILVVMTTFISCLKAIMICIILFPMAVLHVFGVGISAGVGLWGLIGHYNVDGAANLKPALQILYSLAVTQGIIYGYKKIDDRAAKLVFPESVVQEYGYSLDKSHVSAYLEETVARCEKDPSFATGGRRNLVTYAVDMMMEPKSYDSFINGIKVLGVVIICNPDRMILAKHLLSRPHYSCNHVIQRLLETMDSKSPYSGKIRVLAARIVALVASSIHLHEHPGWIHSISSVFETFEEYSRRPEEYRPDRCLPEEYERDWLLEEYEKKFHIYRRRTKSTVKSITSAGNWILLDHYILLVVEGFNILKKLALHPENCKVIINTQGLPLQIMAPLNSNMLHRDHHNVWAAIAMESLEVMIQLAVIPGEIGTKLQGEISRSREAVITTLECILECLDCRVDLKIRTVELLLHLSVDASSMKARGNSGRIFTWLLLLNLSDEEVYNFRQTSRLAGEKKLSWNRELPSQQSIASVLGDLTTALVSAGDISTRVHAAKILHYLVRWCRKDDEYLKELNKPMVSVMPEVLKEILGRGSTREAETKAANNVQPSSSQDVDLEKGGVSAEGEGCKQASSSPQHTGDATGHIERLRDELKRLCWKIQLRWHHEDADVTRQLDGIAEKVCWEQGMPVKTFEELVEEE